jgi:hypothetical protein
MQVWPAMILLAAGCSGPNDAVSHVAGDPMPPAPPARLPSSDCPIIESSGWAAWVNAMPGPGSRPTLIVTGRITVPTGGYAPMLETGPVQEIHPPVQIMILHPNPPRGGATQAIVTHEVRAEAPALDVYGSVVVRCGSITLADIKNIERAY